MSVDMTLPPDDPSVPFRPPTYKVEEIFLTITPEEFYMYLALGDKLMLIQLLKDEGLL
jgi:hypothetical protein